MSEDIAKLRTEIDALDKELLGLVNRRAALARRVGELKHGAPAYRPEREAEILRFLSAGFSNKEVARRLNLSVRTVETHRLNLRRKTQTGRLKDLVALARHLGLTPVVDAAPVRSTGGDRPRGLHASESVARL